MLDMMAISSSSASTSSVLHLAFSMILAALTTVGSDLRVQSFTWAKLPSPSVLPVLYFLLNASWQKGTWRAAVELTAPDRRWRQRLLEEDLRGRLQVPEHEHTDFREETHGCGSATVAAVLATTAVLV